MKRNLISNRLLEGVLAIICSGLMMTAQAQTTVRASVSDGGLQSDGGSPQATICKNGQFVVFSSNATNLVGVPTSGYQVFLRDLVFNTTTLISVDPGGNQANADCVNPKISADGRFVSYSSTATNLDGLDLNGVKDGYVRDRVLGTTIRVTLTNGGGECNGPSDSSAIYSNGSDVSVAFHSTANNVISPLVASGDQVYIRNYTSGVPGATTVIASVSTAGAVGDGISGILQQSISGNGRFVCFSSTSSNLVTGDTNATWDVFLRDLVAGTTIRVSVNSVGAQGALGGHSGVLGTDGRFISFSSNSTNMVASDTNNTHDVFLRDTQLGKTTRISVDSKGKQVNGASGNENGWGLYMNSSATKVVFMSYATNLVAGDTNGVRDIFLRDIATSKTTRISVSSAGAQGNAESTSPTISDTGSYVTFVSLASNLVSGDTNLFLDVFRR